MNKHPATSLQPNTVTFEQETSMAVSRHPNTHASINTKPETETFVSGDKGSPNPNPK